MPLDPTSVLGTVHCADVGHLVHLIIESESTYQSRIIGVNAEELPESQRLKIWGNAVKREVRFRSISKDEYAERIKELGVPSTAAEGFADLYEHFRDNGNVYAGEGVLQAKDLIEMKGWKVFCEEEDWKTVVTGCL